MGSGGIGSTRHVFGALFSMMAGGKSARIPYRGEAPALTDDQDGNFIVAWHQFGQPSSVFVGKDDTIYVGAAFPDPGAKKGELRGIVIGDAKDGSLKAFIPDPSDLDKVVRGTSASGIAADDAGTIYAADVGTHGLRKYLKVR